MPELRRLLRKVYWKLERLIDPSPADAHRFYSEVVRGKIQPNSAWLDVGCGHDIFVPWVPSAADLVKKCKLVVGIDYDLDSLRNHQSIQNRVVADLVNLPCRDESFDHVTANMVMEHVADPVSALTSIVRLLKPGGIFIFHTPNYWNYWTFLPTLVPQKLKNKLIEFVEERTEDDVFPTFYRLNTVSSVTEAAQKAGFAVREVHKISASSSGAILVLGPFIVLHLLFRRLTRWKLLENFRDNFVVVLEKPLSKESDAKSPRVPATVCAPVSS